MSRSSKIRLFGSVAAVAGVLLASACGGGSDKAGSAGPAPSSSASGFAAFQACLQKNGVSTPARTPGAGGGGGGGFGGGGSQSMSPEQQKAYQACRSLMPGRGSGGGFDDSAVTAYRTCLKSHGVTLPTTRPSARPTAQAAQSPRATPGTAGRRPGGFGNGLGNLNTKDPKVAAAVKTCAPLLPSPTPAPANS